MKFDKKWLIPAIAGLAVGWLFSRSISGIVAQTGLPLHSMAARRVTRPMVHPAVRHPVAPPVHTTYVPVRRSFDRSYDSWLHTTVNALPTIG